MKSFAVSFSLLAVVALAGCSGTAESLGLGRNSPDAFAVVDRPPLSLPPDFSLRPPVPGAARPQETALSKEAEKILYGAASEQKTPAPVSDAEKGLLDKVGADKADPYINTLMDWEAQQKVVAEPHLIQELLGTGTQGADGAVTVDAAAEAARLHEAKEKGEPLAAGATPVIEKNKSGWLGL